MNSGKSRSTENPNGKRKINNGLELAPKSLRKRGKIFLKDCSEKELEEIAKVVK